MLKYFSLLMLFLLMLSGCDPSNEQTEDDLIKMKLKASSGFGGFDPNRKVLFPLGETENKLLKDSIPVAEKFEEYVIRMYRLDEQLAMYKKWKQGKITDQRWKALERIYEIDTNALVDIKPSYKMLMAYGTLQDGNRALQVDKNFNNDLSDEDLIKIDHPLEFIDDVDKEYYLENKDQYLPQLDIEVEYQQQDTLIDHQFPLQINPYNVDELIQYVTQDELEKQYYLSVNIPQYYRGQLEVAKDTFQIKITGDHKSPMLNKENTRISIKNTSNSTDSLQVLNESYAIGDSIYLNDEPYCFKEIALNGSELQVEKLDDKTQLYALKEAYYFPKLDADLIYPDKYQINDQKSRTYIVWNTRSMNEKMVRQLKEWQKLHRSQRLIGIAYDGNKGAIKRTIDRIKINFPNYYINPSDDRTLKIEKEQLPLWIKMDKNGIIQKID